MDQTLGHYRLLEKLGEGGMGKVYLAQDERLDRKVALKLLAPGPEKVPQAHRRFLGEARAASALNHPNVCVIHEIGETDDGRLFIAMEFIEGPNLGARLAKEAFSIPDLVEIGIQVADALDAAHSKGIIHRDIKPDNICFSERGRVKVLDFGLAKRLGEDSEGGEELSITRSGTILGTPAYMSPEQVLARSVDHRTDIFSLGVVLYELVTGRLPFPGNSFAEMGDRIVHSQPEALARFNYDVTPELERIVRKCIEKDRERRYQSARDLLIDLENVRRDLSVGSSPAPAAKPDSETVVTENAGPQPVPMASAKLDPAASAPTAADLRKSDVFISYSHVDDQPLSPGRSGWISQFQRHLEVRLSQLSGNKVRIGRPAKHPSEDVVDSRVLEVLPSARAMVTVVSPPFARSEGCRREVRAFLEGRSRHGGLRVADKSRLLKVVKTPVPDPELGDLATIFSDLLSYEFYEEDPATGRIREFDEVFGEEARQRYYERVYDLAFEINQLFRLEETPPNTTDGDESPQTSGNGAPKVVYLAQTTSDLQAEYESVRRELLEQGYRVVPDKPLPTVLDDLEQAVRAYLAESKLVVQLVGRNYGLVPENSRQSLLELQAEWAATHMCQREGERYVWLPMRLDVVDERQAAFIRRLREHDAAHASTELVEGSLTIFKDLLGKALAKRRASEGQKREIGTSGGPSQVYLICDPGDEAAVEPLEDYLFEQGLEVCLPDFGEKLGEVHRDNLRDCDAVLIFYGTARKAWIDIKLRDILKASGYGRSRPFSAQAVYVAPPVDRRKERFKSHVAQVVIRQESEAFAPSAELESFVARVRAAR